MPVLKAGTRLRSAVSAAEFIITKAPATELDLCCGGQPLQAAGSSVTTQEGLEGAVLVGKRYVDASEQVEVLCTKGGAGTLTINGETLNVRSAKALPSSD